MESRQGAVLILGGSGTVGSRVAKTLRRLWPELPLVLGARNAAAANVVAEQVGGPVRVLAVDLARPDLGIPDAQQLGCVATLLKDERLGSLRLAQRRQLPYLSFSAFSFDTAAEVALFVREPGRTSLLMLGHALGGTATLAALHLAKTFRRLDTIAIACVAGPDDLGGPASRADFERHAEAGSSALLLQDGRFVWTKSERTARSFVDRAGRERRGHALPLLDVTSLAAATSARNIRVDFAVRDEPATAPTTELILELTGEDGDGKALSVRQSIVDADVYANLSAYGAALAIERLLGLAGGGPVGPGLHHPETLLDPDQFVRALGGLGAELRPI